MKTISKLIYPTCAAFVLAIAASTANGAPGDDADYDNGNGSTPPPTLRRVALSVSDGEDRGNNNSAAEGIDALNINTIGVNNTAHGWHSLSANTDGSDNTANGFRALFNNTSGGSNTANGSQALLSNTIGSCNTANGFLALNTNTFGSFNTATGFQALLSNTSGTQNTATGVSALGSNTTARYGTASGFEVLGHNTTGEQNTAMGWRALFTNTTGADNTAIGLSALFGNISGNDNTAVGVGALRLSTGTGNIALGSQAGVNVTSANNVISIGSDGANVSNSCYVGNIWNQTTSGGTAVFINNAGKLGTTTSSRRFKEDIKAMNSASEALFALKPVTFRYKKEIDPQGISQFGLIAEDVAEVNPQLVVRDKEGKVNTVRYEQINAMLLNEFLKEHKKVGQLEATVAQQRKDFEAARMQQQNEIEVLIASLKEQAAQIQKVSAQVGMRRSALRVVD